MHSSSLIIICYGCALIIKILELDSAEDSKNITARLNSIDNKIIIIFVTKPKFFLFLEKVR